VGRHRVSPRYVQKLFDSDGTTFSEYVLSHRLVHAHRALSDPRRAAEKIATIAFAAGFGDVSYFYRAFRRRYDMLPSDLRAAARRRCAIPAFRQDPVNTAPVASDTSTPIRRFSTDKLAPRERVEAWREFVGRGRSDCGIRRCRYSILMK
jgi:AraC-like DNA-binding protein